MQTSLCFLLFVLGFHQTHSLGGVGDVKDQSNLAFQQQNPATVSQFPKPFSNVNDEKISTPTKEEQRPAQQSVTQQVVSNTHSLTPSIQSIQPIIKPVAQYYRPFYTPVRVPSIAPRPVYIPFQRPFVQHPYYSSSPSRDSSWSAPQRSYHEKHPSAPTLQIPKTSFTCVNKPYNPGMYADEETGCKVYHICIDDRQESFFCGNSALFNQEILVCDHAAKINCQASQSYWKANIEFGKAPTTSSNWQKPYNSNRPIPRPMPRPIIHQQNYASPTGYGWSSRIHSQMPATNNYQANNGNQFLHFSTHGWSTNNRPLQSISQIQAPVLGQSIKPLKPTTQQEFIPVIDFANRSSHISLPLSSVQQSIASIPVSQVQSLPQPEAIPAFSTVSDSTPPAVSSLNVPKYSPPAVRPLDFSEDDIEGRPKPFPQSPANANKQQISEPNPAPHKIENYKIPANALNISPAMNKGQEQLKLSSSVRSSVV